jgi:hypothetical protein
MLAKVNQIAKTSSPLPIIVDRASPKKVFYVSLFVALPKVF